MKTFIIILTSIFIYSCAPSFKINSYLNKDVTPNEILTYFWSPMQEEVIPGNPLHDNSKHRNYIKQAIDKEMIRKGYILDSLNPDLYIEYFVSLENKRSVITAPLPYVDDFDYEYRVKVEQLKKSSLLVHLENNEQNKTIWIGSAQTIVEAVPTDTKRIINMTIKRIMMSLPTKDAKSHAPNNYLFR